MKKKKTIRTSGICVAVLLATISLLTGAVWLFVIERPTRISDFLQTQTDKWNRIDLGNTVTSADGSEYYVLTKKGQNPEEENNWIIYFSGGGMNWDENSTANPINLANILKGEGLTYFSSIPFYKLNTMKGILEEGNDKNPFGDWNYLYIPYATGDFHIGNNLVEYERKGKTYKSFHNGRNNVLAALEWFQRNAGTPDKIFVCGESAGGFGAAFWTPYIAESVPEARIYEYTDSSYIQTDKWEYIMDSYWNAEVEDNFHFRPEADIIKAVFQANAEKHPDITYLQSNTLYDNLLLNFQKRLNDEKVTDLEYKDIWSTQMLASAAALSENFSNYHYFITDYGLDEKTGTTPHTLSASKDFYESKEDGISLSEWLYQAVEFEAYRNVGSRFMR
ncbi:pectin acetylesterase-family hydrolase [Anaerocolumna sp. AGMB13020]|uniref:pectin acetylesterase-family hydrolase n=1 Tax=Anaerocolumna sp. AGMB13020 TaxID=3081750 RepID=UPI00295380E3|nr:pectin acetylesterase-family hydrolase [Anaerocolumna sp. AGMB13020]WOO35954.1 pectin acetylesterase-family hydrolase [Anaerocolumna sp. AGMB13020]